MGLSSSAKVLDRLDANVPPDLDAHIIMDNYETHETPPICAGFAKQPRFDVHFTRPTGPGSTSLSLGSPI